MEVSVNMPYPQIIETINMLLKKVSELEKSPVKKNEIDDVLTLQEAAKYLKESERSLRNAIGEGRLIATGKGKYRILKNDIENYLNDRESYKISLDILKKNMKK